MIFDTFWFGYSDLVQVDQAMGATEHIYHQF